MGYFSGDAKSCCEHRSLKFREGEWYSNISKMNYDQ